MKRQNRMEREVKTVIVMVRLFCQRHHGFNELCADCRELGDYARERLEKCPFQQGKTVCSLCAVHCYKPEMREKIRTVMRYSGPRMLTTHPLMAVQHLIDKRRKTPQKSSKINNPDTSSQN